LLASPATSCQCAVPCSKPRRASETTAEMTLNETVPSLSCGLKPCLVGSTAALTQNYVLRNSAGNITGSVMLVSQVRGT
jgi:hypothetical protein